MFDVLIVKNLIISFLFTVLLVGAVSAQQLPPLPVMLSVKAVQKTGQMPGAVLDRSENVYKVEAHTLEEALQTLMKEKVIHYFPDDLFTQQIREMNPHLSGKQLCDAGVFVVPQLFESPAEKRYGFNYGARQPWIRSEQEASEHLQKLLASYTTLEQWEARKKMLRENILRQAQLDPLPRKNPLNPIYGKPRSYKGYSVTAVGLEILPGYWFCGQLYQPTNVKGKTPAMLCPHGHFFNTKDTFLITERGHFRPEHQIRCAMLAQMGITIFSYGMFAFGGELSLQIPFHGNHTHPFALTMQFWNAMRALDFLCSLETVDQTRIGTTGASGGGTQSFMISAVDPRITFSVPIEMISAYFYGGCACESGWPIHQTHGGLNTNNAEIAAMTAPRPQLLISITDDWTKNNPTVEIPYLKKIYGLYGKVENIENVHLDEQHDYAYTKREPMYDFVTRVCNIDAQKFKDAQGRYDEKNAIVENPEKMLVFGNGRIINGYYVLQPVKTRPMLPASDIHGLDDLIRVFRQQQQSR